MTYKQKIYDLLEKKFSTHPEYLELREIDLNADYDSYKGTYTSDEIIGFEFRSDIGNATQAFGGKLELDFDKMRCFEHSYQKSISQAWFKKLDREFERELASAVLVYYILDLHMAIDYELISVDKFIKKNYDLLHIIYENATDPEVGEMFLSPAAKDVFLF